MIESRMRTVAVAAALGSSRQVCRLRLSRSRPDRDLSRLAVVASMARANGISRGAQLQYDALRRAGRQTQLIDVDSQGRSRLRRISHEPASTYVFHVAGPQTSLLLQRVLPDAAEAWRVGYWAWELAKPPADWRGCDKLVSEVWAPSTFAASSLRGIASVPIRVVPHYVAPQDSRQRNFNQRFTALVIADSRSSFTRKNPAGAVDAFIKAFDGRTDVRLILKLNGRPSEMVDLATAIRAQPNVTVVQGFLNDTEMAELYRSADVLLSLHRAEGFGLPMLEAMSYGIPVVGTGWSGNTDFMSDTNSALVPFELVQVRDEAGIYRGDYMWAEPDIDAAAQWLRTLCDDPTTYLRLAASAYRTASMSEPSDILTRMS